MLNKGLHSEEVGSSETEVNLHGWLQDKEALVHRTPLNSLKETDLVGRISPSGVRGGIGQKPSVRQPELPCHFVSPQAREKSVTAKQRNNRFLSVRHPELVSGSGPAPFDPPCISPKGEKLLPSTDGEMERGHVLMAHSSVTPKNEIAYGKNQTEFEKESLASQKPLFGVFLPLAKGEYRRLSIANVGGEGVSSNLLRSIPTLPQTLLSQLKGEYRRLSIANAGGEGVSHSQVQTNRRLLVLPPWGELEGVSNLTILTRQLTDDRSTLMNLNLNQNNRLLKPFPFGGTEGGQKTNDHQINSPFRGIKGGQNTPQLFWPGRPGSRVQTFINLKF